MYEFRKGEGWVLQTCERVVIEYERYNITLSERIPEPGEFYFCNGFGRYNLDWFKKELTTMWWLNVFDRRGTDSYLGKWTGVEEIHPGNYVVLTLDYK